MTKGPQRFIVLNWMLLAWTVVFLWGCAHHRPLPREDFQLAYQVSYGYRDSIHRWAPVFVAYGHRQDHNRIGRPRAVPISNGGHKIEVDTQAPTVYYMQRRFKTDRAAYTNLIYRVHFPGIPFSLIPFNVSAGKNVGLMAVVTLDEGNRPVLFTTVHTCGCYKAIVATRYLSETALPQNWQPGRFKVYGEHLPAHLDFRQIENPRFVVHLRPEVHRVMDIEVRDEAVIAGDSRFKQVRAVLAPMADLARLPVNDDVTSLFHGDGNMKGYVKGSVKPLESIFLSLISLDFFVGTDKAYADPAITGKPFYTSLKPWRRRESDMWDFAGFLRYWGWRL